jgi:hypothetical protein
MAAENQPPPGPRQVLAMSGGHQLVLHVGPRDGFDIMLDVELRLASGARFGSTFATLDQIRRTWMTTAAQESSSQGDISGPPPCGCSAARC